MKPVTTILVAMVLAAGAAAAAQAKELAFCAAQNPEGFDPAPHITGATFDASSEAIYDRLVAFAPGTTRPVPALAEGWDVSVDGLEYTFHLRAGVKFQTTYFFTPSRDLNADDVVFSLTRQMDGKNPYYDYAGGVWPYFDGMAMPALIGSITKVDDATVKIKLARPDPAILGDLAMDFASIVSKEYADQLTKEKKPGDLDRLPVGTGPFQFVGYQPDVRINYRANPDYWGGKPAIDRLAFLINPDPIARARMMTAGQCQVMADPTPAIVARLKSDPDIAVAQAQATDVAYLAYNTKQKPFDDVRVRKALNQAIDRHALVDAVYGGDAAVPDSPLSASMWSHVAVIPDDKADPDAAKAALAAAGVSDLKMKIWVPPVSRGYAPDARHMAEMIKADLAKAGVTADVVSDDLGAFIKKTAAPDHDGAVLFGWVSDNGDPDNFLGVLLGCDAVGVSNRAEWCNHDFDKAVLDARKVADPAEREKLYGTAQQVFADEAPWLTIAHTTVSVPVAKTVKGYVADPLGRHSFAGVDVE